MLIVGYCYGIRLERLPCEEVTLHLTNRWFCRLDLNEAAPDNSTFSVIRHGRFPLQRHITADIRGGGICVH